MKNSNLDNITQANAVNTEGKKITDFAVNTGEEKIFEENESMKCSRNTV